jgi:glycosyltransferase involved in cell wall biosynthesis
MPRIIYVINDVRFVLTHFGEWLATTLREGRSVVIHSHVETVPEALRVPGIEISRTEEVRGGFHLPRLWRSAKALRQLSETREPTIIHCFGLHGMAMTALSRLRGAHVPVVVSITGFGLLATVRGPMGLPIRLAVRVLAWMLKSPQTMWIAENRHDVAFAGLRSEHLAGRVVLVVGAGVDIDKITALPLARTQSLRLILISRMIWSKGIDLAVAALQLARSQGVDVTLTLVGDPDAGNPRSYQKSQLLEFAAIPGVIWLGQRDNIPELLASHDVFLLPSRGGEGLPKALLEAAAAGRPAIVTDVPGCADFVEDGVTGWIVPAEDTSRLAEAMIAACHADLGQMGRAARRKVETQASAKMVARRVNDIYTRLS